MKCHPYLQNTTLVHIITKQHVVCAHVLLFVFNQKNISLDHKPLPYYTQCKLSDYIALLSPVKAHFNASLVKGGNKSIKTCVTQAGGGVCNIG